MQAAVLCLQLFSVCSFRAAHPLQHTDCFLEISASSCSMPCICTASFCHGFLMSNRADCATCHATANHMLKNTCGLANSTKAKPLLTLLESLGMKIPPVTHAAVHKNCHVSEISAVAGKHVDDQVPAAARCSLQAGWCMCCSSYQHQLLHCQLHWNSCCSQSR